MQDKVIVYLLTICLVVKSYLVNRATERAATRLRGEWNVSHFFANCWMGKDAPFHSHSIPKAFYVCMKSWKWEQPKKYNNISIKWLS